MATKKRELTIADLERIARDYEMMACDPCVSPASREWAAENARKARRCIEERRNAARKTATANATKANKNAVAARARTKPAKPEGASRPFDPAEFERKAQMCENLSFTAMTETERKAAKEEAKSLRRILAWMKRAGWLRKNRLPSNEVNKDLIEVR